MGTTLSPPTLVPAVDFFVTYHRLSNSYGRDNTHSKWKSWNKVGHLKTHLLHNVKHYSKNIWYNKYFGYPLAEWEIWNHKNGQWEFVSWLDAFVEKTMKPVWNEKHEKEDARIKAYHEKIGYTPT